MWRGIQLSQTHTQPVGLYYFHELQSEQHNSVQKKFSVSQRAKCTGVTVGQDHAELFPDRLVSDFATLSLAILL